MLVLKEVFAKFIAEGAINEQKKQYQPQKSLSMRQNNQNLGYYPRNIELTVCVIESAADFKMFIA
jgi:hypothetical protein